MADIDENIEISSRNRNRTMRTTLEKNKDDEQELSAKVRNVLLVVVTLVASVTFSAGVNPPGGVWQETTAANCTCTTANGTNTSINATDHTAGEAILASKPVPYSMFLIANTVAFSTSAFVISTLVSVYPFKTEIWIAVFAMSFTYGAAISAVTPAYIKFRYVFPAFTAPLLIVAFTWLRKKTLSAVYYMRRSSTSS